MPVIAITGYRINTDRITSSEAETDGTFTYYFDGGTSSFINVSAADAATIQAELETPLPVLSTEGAPAQQAFEYATEYADEGSFQILAADLTLAAGAGTSDAGDTDFLAPIMANLLGDDLTKTNNYLAGLIGALSVTGNRATILPLAAILGVIMDGVSAGDGIIVAHIDGSDPSAQTNVRAAFAVSQANTHADSGVEYGVDLKHSPSAELNTLLSGAAKAFKITKALVRSPNNVVIMEGDGAPVDGTTGDNFAGPGSMYVDYTNANAYINAGTISAPVWKLVTRAS